MSRPVQLGRYALQKSQSKSNKFQNAYLIQYTGEHSFPSFVHPSRKLQFTGWDDVDYWVTVPWSKERMRSVFLKMGRYDYELRDNGISLVEGNVGESVEIKRESADAPCPKLGFGRSRMIGRMDGWFRNCDFQLIDMFLLDTSKVTSMNNVFQNCKYLTSLDVATWDTSNVTSMLGMFDGCEALSWLNLSSFDTSKVFSMTRMFNGCAALTELDLRSFNLDSLATAQDMFAGCSNLTCLVMRGKDLKRLASVPNAPVRCSFISSIPDDQIVDVRGAVEESGNHAFVVSDPTEAATPAASTGH